MASGRSVSQAISVHRMPFGTEVQDDGRISFRLFGPAVDAVRVKLDGVAEPIPAASNGSGWHVLTTSEAKAGTQYSFVLPDGSEVPDPASRYQPRDVHGPSEVIDPAAYTWRDEGWTGRRWEEAVLYELHVGTFTPEGTFRAAIDRLDHLAELGVTSIELMCLSDFAGNRNWGYDGVLLYAPDSAYGRPEDVKAFIDEAHARKMMVILDVVYNHFGPEGNYISRYFPQVCSDRHKDTPWGGALNFDGQGSSEVRDFILHNALYWVEEFHVDGLRIDASHAMIDESPRHVLNELKDRVQVAANGRIVHLILESEDNVAERLTRDSRGGLNDYTAQWNHDITHLLAAVLGSNCEERRENDQGETEKLGKAISRGFVIAAEEEGCTGLEREVPPTAFVAFIQTHDLIGNRIFGDRIFGIASRESVRAIAAIYLLLPQIPMIFMGEEWAASSPFPFFCDYQGELAEAVRKGRCEQLSKQDPAPSADEMKRAPDPQAEETLRSAQLRWEELKDAGHAEWFGWYKQVLQVRQRFVVPVLKDLEGSCSRFEVLGPGRLKVTWDLADGVKLYLATNLCSEQAAGFGAAVGEVIWMEGSEENGTLGPWSVRWSIKIPDREVKG